MKKLFNMFLLSKKLEIFFVSVSCSMIAKQFLESAARDQKSLTSSRLQFIDSTVKSKLFVRQGNSLH